jgi:hypothetical protein
MSIPMSCLRNEVELFDLNTQKLYFKFIQDLIMSPILLECMSLSL